MPDPGCFLLLHNWIPLTYTYCCVKRLGCVTIFWQFYGYTTYFCVFRDLNLTSKISNSEQNGHTGHLKFLRLQRGTQKSKFDNFNQKWSCRLQMLRGFKVWFQNLNQTTFGLLFGKRKAVRTGKLQFLTIFGQKETNIARFKFWGYIWNDLKNEGDVFCIYWLCGPKNGAVTIK